VKEQTVELTVRPETNKVLSATSLTLPYQITVDGNAAKNCTVIWSSSNPAVATVSNGVVSAVKEGQITITATVTHANGKALEAPISVETVLTVEKNTISASGTMKPATETVSTLQIGVPYVITEASSGAALTGTMLYKTSAGYAGLSGTQGLMTVDSYDLNDAPVWYYDGSRLLWGSPTGSNNYLVLNSSNQIALGSKTATNIFDRVVPYSTSQKTFNIYASNKGTSYINQLGGSKYNVVGLYSSAYYSRWQFRKLHSAAPVTLDVTPGKAFLTTGTSLAIDTIVKAEGKVTGTYVLDWSSSNTSVAVVNSAGVITATGSGNVVITGTLTAVNGRELVKPVTVKITLQITAGAGYTVTSVQEGQLTKVDKLTKNTPYVLMEKFSGVVLTGDMIYTTDKDYNGLSGTEGLKLAKSFDMNNAPVWYYDGTHLLYGSSTGSNNYLVLNSSNQVALGSINEANIFDRMGIYDASVSSFVLYPSGKTSGSTNYYLNQLGGTSYNAAGLWHYASSSQWFFCHWIPERTISMQVTPNVNLLTPGQKATLKTDVSVNNVATNDCVLTWQTSDASVVTVSNGSVTAVGSGTATITVTITGADGITFRQPVSVTIPITVN
jgi:uncharacterized protein YjdB